MTHAIRGGIVIGLGQMRHQFSMTKITLSRELFNRMISHCRSVFPNEACGMFAGRDGIAERIYEMANVESSPVSYMMDPKAQFVAMKEMRERGEKMVSIYHSHPQSQAYPSNKDVEIAFYSDAVYIIVSLLNHDDPVIRAFEIAGGEVLEADIEVHS